MIRATHSGLANLAWASIAIAAVALALGLGALTARYESGIRWAVQEGRLVVASVDPLSQAERDGVEPGMFAVWLNGTHLIELPAPEYGEPDPANPDAPLPIIRLVPPLPANATLGPGELEELARQPVADLGLIAPAGLASGTFESWPISTFYYPGAYGIDASRIAILPGLAILLVGAWWLQSGRFGAALRGLALPLATATAVPFLVLPMGATGTFPALAVAGILTIVAMLPLAFGLARLVTDPDQRRLVQVGIAILAAAGVAGVVGAAVGFGQQDTRGTIRWLLLGSIPLLPGLAAAGPLDLGRLRGVSSRGAGGLLRSTELALVGATPLFAIGTDRFPFVLPLALWFAAIFVAARFTVRPLALLATRAALQRDLVVAATEAERARLAADIHDDALQELTLLVRRLEASGDTEGAEIGRTVADRLRAICGDLRLPILDDLGVGPALDWLVLRIERLAGGEVRLERSADARHSPDVELAIFRVAQEALANAVKHGRPPIVVRYRSTPGGISLAIDDAGPGISDQDPADAERAGRYGLLNMAQRAEQIGAILDIKRWPTGGTHVALEWRPR